MILNAIESMRPTAEAKGVQLEYRADLDRDECVADRKRLQQVVGNLLSNAVEFTPEGGRVLLTLAHEAGFLKLEVNDTGAGIRTDSLRHIFSRFWQDKRVVGTESGLALGISIVRQFVEMHRGTVRAESEGEGHGTTVTVLLPQR